MRKHSIVFILLYIFITLLFYSCKEDSIEPELTGSISGNIIDLYSGITIPNVLITPSPATGSILSDGSGKFLLENLTVGAYSITANKTGYHKTVVNVSVKSDETTIANILMEPGNDNNSTPIKPENPSPQNNAVGISINPTLSWYQSNSIKTDTLKFTVRLFEPNSVEGTLLAKDITDTLFTLSNLDYNTNYRWQVTVKNSKDESTLGEVWSFRTHSLPDNPYYYSSNRDGVFAIFTSDGTIGNTIKLTNDSFNNYNPRVNHYKDLIAFSSNRDLDLNIYTINKQGKELTKITQIPIAGFHNNGTGFDWSPDGQYLIYPSYDKLYRILYSGGVGNVIATAPPNMNIREACYNSKGDKIIMLVMGQNFYKSEIYMMNADGSEMKLLVGDLPGALGSPSFSINGNYFMYTHDVDGFEDVTNRQTNSHIFLVSIDTLTAVTDLSKDKPIGTNDFEPRFSPDGSKIIFTNVKSNNEEYTIWIMDPSGNNRTKIAENGRMPDWR